MARKLLLVLLATAAAEECVVDEVDIDRSLPGQPRSAARWTSATSSTA